MFMKNIEENLDYFLSVKFLITKTFAEKQREQTIHNYH